VACRRVAIFLFSVQAFPFLFPLKLSPFSGCLPVYSFGCPLYCSSCRQQVAARQLQSFSFIMHSVFPSRFCLHYRFFRCFVTSNIRVGLFPSTFGAAFDWISSCRAPGFLPGAFVSGSGQRQVRPGLLCLRLFPGRRFSLLYIFCMGPDDYALRLFAAGICCSSQAFFWF